MEKRRSSERGVIRIRFSRAESVSVVKTDMSIINLVVSHMQTPVFITEYVIKFLKGFCPFLAKVAELVCDFFISILELITDEHFFF